VVALIRKEMKRRKRREEKKREEKKRRINPKKMAQVPSVLVCVSF
jgi:hypothetical protein